VSRDLGRVWSTGTEETLMSTRHGFWIAVNDNHVFDGIVIRHLIAHGDIVTINAFYESDSYSFANIVGRR
jgi:hypothetical protein